MTVPRKMRLSGPKWRFDFSRKRSIRWRNRIELQMATAHTPSPSIVSRGEVHLGRRKHRECIYKFLDNTQQHEDQRLSIYISELVFRQSKSKPEHNSDQNSRSMRDETREILSERKESFAVTHGNGRYTSCMCDGREQIPWFVWFMGCEGGAENMEDER